MEGYNKIIYLNSNKTPYAIYQKAISYGFVDRNLKKIETLKLLIKEFHNSFYTDDALFELAMTLSFETKYDESITYYDKIIRIEYSINKLGEKGVFLHFSNPF